MLNRTIVMILICMTVLVLLTGCGGGPAVSPVATAAALDTTSAPTSIPNNAVVATATTAGVIDTPVPTSAITTASNSSLQLDGCALLRSAGVETIFGKALKDPGPEPGGGVIGSCKWTFDAHDGGMNPGTLGLQIFLPPEGFKPADAYSQMRDTIVSFTGTVKEPVPGFGPQSVWEASPGAGQFATLTSGGLVVFINGFKVTNLDKVSSLAKGVIDELPR